MSSDFSLLTRVADSVLPAGEERRVPGQGVGVRVPVTEDVYVSGGE